MAATPTSPANLVRFGIFEVDLAAGELRKSGVRIRLQEQPFQVLTLLVQRPSELVTREELRQKLWPADTFVDFDHSLNTAINKLREALNDSAATPRYIETLPRRGYRFVATVERVAAVEPAAARGSIHPELQVRLPHRTLSRSLFALIQVMYLIFYLAALFHLNGVDRAADNVLPSEA